MNVQFTPVGNGQVAAYVGPNRFPVATMPLARSKSGSVNISISWENGSNFVDSREVAETIREALRIAIGDVDVTVKVQSAVIVQEREA